MEGRGLPFGQYRPLSSARNASAARATAANTSARRTSAAAGGAICGGELRAPLYRYYNADFAALKADISGEYPGGAYKIVRFG